MDSYTLAQINSLTKYGSIPTFHVMDGRGNLQEAHVSLEGPFSGPLLLTEKVDGTNVRIILYPDGDYIIGSREELLYAKGDRIENPALGIVQAVKPIAERISASARSNFFCVVYGEVYGGNVGKAARQYSPDRETTGFRVFDVFSLPMVNYDSLLKNTPAQIASWRDNGGPMFISNEALAYFAKIEELELVPRLTAIQTSVRDYNIPTTIEGMYNFLQYYKETQVVLSENHTGHSEGLVLRSEYRDFIAKVRFEDYNKAMRLRGKTKN